MKVVYIILLACLFIFVSAEEFCMNFYKKPDFKSDQGVICGEISPGEVAGTLKRNWGVASFTAPSFLQVTLYEGKFYTGASHVYTGTQKNISPAVHVGSLKWKNLHES